MRATDFLHNKKAPILTHMFLLEKEAQCGQRMMKMMVTYVILSELYRQAGY